jgi:sterol O-acyltransferase
MTSIVEPNSPLDATQKATHMQQASTTMAALDRMTPPPPLRYQHRRSRLDREHLNHTKEQFRGIFTLFWIAMGCYVVLTTVRNLTEQGIILSGTLFSIFSSDALTLAASDALMVFSTSLALPICWLESRGWIGRNVFLAIQIIYETAFMSIATYWAVLRSWPWVQSTFFICHSIVMLMKLHSYMARNHEFAWMNERATLLRSWLKYQNKDKSEATSEKSPVLQSDDAANTAVDSEITASSTAIESPMADAQLRQRHTTHQTTVTTSRSGRASPNEMPSSLLQQQLSTKKYLKRSFLSEALIAQANVQISIQDAQKELAELEEDLGFHQPVTYPANLNLLNFGDYLLVPSLVYELNYPRTDRIRPAFIFEKIAAILGTFMLLYITVEHYVIPVLRNTAHLPIWYALPQLLCPTLIVFILVFFIIFEFICNGFAELSR